MAAIKVNPTRMELKKLKGRLVTARRGHKLMKNKCDELMRQFLLTVREAKELREELGDALEDTASGFESAAAESDVKMMFAALMLPGTDGTLEVSYENRMSVIVPRFDYKTFGSGAGYGFAFTSGEFDEAVSRLSEVSERMVHLAQLEKTALLLCDEIEKTRRRVNALEYIMIPQYETTIKEISMKLEENERGNLTRLMKVKDMLLSEAKSQLQSESTDQ